MSGKTIKPADGTNWLKVSRELIASDAWRSMPINVRRLIDWLIYEHLSKGGKENGNLKAPYRQLYAFGIGTRYAVEAIAGAEERGLVRCHRPGRRMMTTFALTWLPLRDGTGPTDEWRAYRDPSLRPLKNRNLHVKGNAELHSQGNADDPKTGKSACQRECRTAKNLHSQGNALSRSSYQGGRAYSDGRERTGRRATGAVNGYTAEPDRVVVPAGADIPSGKPVTVEQP